MFRTLLPLLGHARGFTFLFQTGISLRLGALLLLFGEKRFLLSSFGLFAFRSIWSHHRRRLLTNLLQARLTLLLLQSFELLELFVAVQGCRTRADDLRDGLVGLFRGWKLFGNIELDRDGMIQNLSDSIGVLISLLLMLDGSGDIKLCLELRSITSERARDNLIVLILQTDYDILSRASIGALNYVGWVPVQELSADFRTLLEVETSSRIAVLGKGLDHQLVCTSGVPRYS